MASAAIVVAFAWINLTILDSFGTGASLQLFVERLPARDLTLSLADLPIELRLAGLDRDPGWVPAAGRYIAFHFG